MRLSFADPHSLAAMLVSQAQLALCSIDVFTVKMFLDDSNEFIWGIH